MVYYIANLNSTLFTDTRLLSNMPNVIITAMMMYDCLFY